MSRETFLLLNNVLLVIACALVFMGTLAPLVVEVLNAGKISVGPPWFELAFMIPMIPLVILVGMGMHSAWRTQAAEPLLKKLRVPAIVAVVIGVVIPGVFYGRFGVLVSVGTIAAAWIIIVALLDPIRSWRREKGTAGMTRGMLGMSVAHFGLGLFVLGVAVVSAFQNVAADLRDSDQTLDCDVLVTGDKAASREIVVDLAAKANLQAWHAGALANSAATEALT